MPLSQFFVRGHTCEDCLMGMPRATATKRGNTTGTWWSPSRSDVHCAWRRRGEGTIKRENQGADTAPVSSRG